MKLRLQTFVRTDGGNGRGERRFYWCWYDLKGANDNYRIWEKKYGKNANHAKKQREGFEASGRSHHPRPAMSTRLTRDAPSHPSAPIQRERLQNTSKQQYQQADAGWGKRSNTGASSSLPVALPYSAPRISQPRTAERPLHPSWEAKKKQKEKQSAGILPAQGTKIKF